jgi:glycosyltransferase involved in cell wall biosynthesis
MAVIRQVRPAEALFYNAFQELPVRFIYATQKPVSYPVKVDRLELVNLPFRPKYFFDPIALVNRGVYTHRSWVEIEGLEKELEDVEVINISDTFYVWDEQVARLARKLKKKLVSVVWESVPHHLGAYLPPYTFSVRAVRKTADLYILRSNTALAFTDSIKIPREKVKVIYKGVDLSLFYPPQERSSKAVTILYVGMLDRSKGVEDLVRAFTRLSGEFSGLRLILAGRGPLEGFIKKEAERYPIDYRGFVDYSSLPDLYREADIFCSPSREGRYLGVKIWDECFSYTLMEAQASGLPIVATRIGGIPEEVGAGNLLVEQRDVEGIRHALKKLVKDQSLRKELGAANRARAEKLFSLKSQAQKTERAILSIL